MLDEYNYFYYGKNGKIHLTFSETMLLNYLIENKHKVNSTKVMADELDTTESCVKSNIYRLRIKLKGEFDIYTKKGGFGYYL